MKKVLKLYKKMSETPLETIQRWKKENPEYSELKMTYAGRLDPMAEGELLVLVGEECKKKDEYLGLDKEYEMDVLFGFSTDTYDILGLINGFINLASSQDYVISDHARKVGRFLIKLVGKQIQKYPSFSSMTVNGKQLFQITRDGELNDIEIPIKEIEVYKAELLKNYFITGRDLKADIMKRILLVRGDFRQEEILEKWNQVLTGREMDQFLVTKIKVKCSSGTYMRSIAQRLGEFLGIPALAFGIKRINIYI